MSEVVADNMQMLGRKGDAGEAPAASEAGLARNEIEEAPF